MPTQWTGTVEERIARLEQAGRRCDGNSRFCTRAAVMRYELLPADGNGNAIPGQVAVKKKACSFHKKQFDGNGFWVVFSKRSLGFKPGSHRSEPARFVPEPGDDGLIRDAQSTTSESQ